MNLVEMNDAILVSNKFLQKVPEITDDKIIEFKRLLKISSRIEAAYEETEDSNSFFSLFPDIKKIIGASLCVEIFYAVKTGFYYSGVPSKLVYILHKLFTDKKFKSVNMSLNSGITYLQLYCKSCWEYKGQTVDMRNVIENVLGRPVTLLTSSVPKTNANGLCEIWIQNVERVALLPDNIFEKLSYQDCEKVEYTPDGLSLNGILLRTFNDRLGVVKDDFDLREYL